MRRRDFLAGVGGAASGLLPRTGHPEQAAGMVRIGLLSPGPRPAGRSANLEGLLTALHDLGYRPGHNIELELRFADWDPVRLRNGAIELVGREVDVIVAWSTPAALAAQQATRTIPIIAGSMGDPVGDGLVASLGSPGGNVTGTTFIGPELVGKRFELLREAVPRLSRIAALWHPGAYSKRTSESFLREAEEEARKLGVGLELAPVFRPEDFDSAFSVMASQQADALMVMPSVMLYAEHRRIVDLAARYRLPAMYQAREFVDAGGLMSYGANIPELLRRCANYVDKILKGAKPGQLPIEQPTKFELIVNLRTAQALGLTFPPSLLVGADEVIE